MNALRKLVERLDPYSATNITYEKALKSRRWSVLHGTLGLHSGDRLRKVYVRVKGDVAVSLHGAQDVEIQDCRIELLAVENTGENK